SETDAKATEIRLKPLQDVAAGKLLGSALIEAAKTGRVGSMAITTDLLTAIGRE
ncbi:MAG: hypothetical protein HKM24_07275, partial [Gammaproteobacteria bacterium]|nr:hypothetical protein [Gammaproteobacteria bacterium]